MSEDAGGEDNLTRLGIQTAVSLTGSRAAVKTVCEGYFGTLPGLAVPRKRKTA